MAVCILCREDLAKRTGTIEIFSMHGVRLNICSIIAKHFWLKPNSVLCQGQAICLTCWESLLSFHQFYQRVAEAHNHLESKDVFSEVAEGDPFAPEVVLKSEEELSIAGQLVEALGENFFDSEIKVEVHDLDLLPKVEIIEGKQNFSERALRASRRGRSRNFETEKKSPATKRIKCEIPQPAVQCDDSENELPLATLICAVNKDIIQEGSVRPVELNQEVPSSEGITTGGKFKNRRGRPKKLKAVAMADDNSLVPINDSLHIKAEQPASIGDQNEFLDDVPTAPDIGTEDSSSSSNETDSDDSLPDVEPLEQYADIPKRVVVKPKKYRKRQKPLVPPKRLTREEIDQKNAQQAEYDKILKQFFQKFVCPKCNLLVVDFGTMRKHFSASHNDSGYLLCCGKKFFQRKTLVEHIYLHWNPEHYKCTKCGKICQDSRTLEAHENTHLNPPEIKEKKTFQCEKCPKSFTTKVAVEHHAFAKHVPKSEFKFTCTECKKKLPTERKLKDHIKYAHDPESAIICDKCGKKMRSQSNLKKHHEIEHSDMPRPVPVPMQCEICGTWLRHLSGLKQHMKSIHEEAGGEHRCHICNKTSTNARALKRHIYHNHECERKFKCTMCEKAFKRPQDLREHTSVHTGEVLYTCPNCPMTFFSNANMYKHRQRLHRVEWETDRKKPRPPNIMQQAVGATAAMKIQQAVGANSAFFANKADLRFTTDLSNKDTYL